MLSGAVRALDSDDSALRARALEVALDHGAALLTLHPDDLPGAVPLRVTLERRPREARVIMAVLALAGGNFPRMLEQIHAQYQQDLAASQDS